MRVFSAPTSGAQRRTNFMDEQPKTPDSPEQSLEHIRGKMESLAADYNVGKINRDQFDAIYAHYTDQMAVLERMIETNLKTDAWKRVAAPGVTSYLHQYHAARPLLITTLRFGAKEPIFLHGKVSPDTARDMAGVLSAITSGKATPGLVRRQLRGGWLVVFVGAKAATLVVYSAEATKEQAERVADAHRLFERANAIALEQEDSPAHRYVFPQRSLTR